MSGSALTGNNNYFEDFTPGSVMRHARGKTVENAEHVLLTNLMMNTAHGHFNEHVNRDRMFGQRMAFGGYTASLVLGLASQDTAEQVTAELGMDGMKLPAPVFDGDTIYAYTEVVSCAPSEKVDSVGVVEFRHWGVNQKDEIVFEGTRRALVKKRPAAA